jgi:hypothetical protein
MQSLQAISCGPDEWLRRRSQAGERNSAGVCDATVLAAAGRGGADDRQSGGRAGRPAGSRDGPHHAAAPPVAGRDLLARGVGRPDPLPGGAAMGRDAIRASDCPMAATPPRPLRPGVRLGARARGCRRPVGRRAGCAGRVACRTGRTRRRLPPTVGRPGRTADQVPVHEGRRTGRTEPAGPSRVDRGGLSPISDSLPAARRTDPADAGRPCQADRAQRVGRVPFGLAVTRRGPAGGVRRTVATE